MSQKPICFKRCVKVSTVGKKLCAENTNNCGIALKGVQITVAQSTLPDFLSNPNTGTYAPALGKWARTIYSACARTSSSVIVVESRTTASLAGLSGDSA